MNLPNNLRQSVYRLMNEPQEEMTRARKALRYVLDFAKYCYKELKADRAGEMAAAMTYHTLFSLLPTIVLMLVVMQTFVKEADRENLKQSAVDFALQWIQPEDKAETVLPQEWQGPTLPDNQDDQAAKEEFDNARRALTKNVQDVISRLEDVKFASIGVVGVIIFLFATTKLLSTIEHSFNRIYDAPYRRPLYIRLPLYYTAITFAPLLLLAGQYAQSLIEGWIEQAAEVAGAGGSVGWLGELTALLTPFATTWLLILLLYRFLPNTKVSSRASAIGAFVAAVGWIVNIEVFKFYVSGLGTSKLYGALALLPVFLLWLYATWLIVLFGIEVTYTIQMMKGKRFKSLRTSEDRDVLFDPRWMIPVTAIIARSFEKGKAIRFNELQTTTGLPNRAVANLIDILTGGNIIHHVEHGEPGVPAYALARPPEKIGVDELLDLSERAAMREKNRAHLAGVDIVADLHAAQLAAAKGTTLADVMGDDE